MSCNRNTWKRILLELRARSLGTRESGGFLLGRREGGCRIILDLLPYDAVDPDSLRGAIVFDGSYMDVVWDECRRRELQVVADVHTHPGGYGQSAIDQQHPMIPQRGHIGLIVPNFADRLYLPGQVGIYEYLGRGRWENHSARGSEYFAVRRFG